MYFGLTILALGTFTALHDFSLCHPIYNYSDLCQIPSIIFSTASLVGVAAAIPVHGVWGTVCNDYWCRIADAVR